MDAQSLNVIFLSHWFDNPYKKLLIRDLETRQVKVKDEYRTNFFIQKFLGNPKIHILHTHELHTFFSNKRALPGLRTLKFCLFVLQILLLKVLGIKIIWTVHEWKDRFEGGKRDLPVLYLKVLRHLIDAIIVHCQTTYQDVVSAFELENKGKVFVIPHGNYIDVFANEIQPADARQHLGIPLHKVTFLRFGFIQPSKGFLESIQAFKRLPSEQTQLIIAGYPADTDLATRIEQEIAGCDNILFKPERIPDEDIQIYMNACDCTVVPYKVFTTSGVTILSMSYGKACIAPKLGFFSDVLDQAGSILYDADADEGLFEAMQTALRKQSLLASMGQHNFELAQHWHWDGIAEQTHAVYRQCVTQRTRS
jgi:beta-1,4-mannosyltransferase